MRWRLSGDLPCTGFVRDWLELSGDFLLKNIGDYRNAGDGLEIGFRGLLENGLKICFKMDT